MTSALSPAARGVALDALAATTAADPLDVLVVGGGITGVGIAHDAATRGLSTAVVEQRDLGSGTSSRSSKLLHGGLRYLEMLDFGLVREALQERGLQLTRLAPHLVRPVPFLYPLRHRWERPYVGAGLALYDGMATFGKYEMGVPRHRHLFRRQVERIAPDLRTDDLVGAIRYYDCQVDDARLVVTIARTAASHGAHVATRTRVTGFLREAGRVVGVRATDLESGRELEVRARVVINAAGVWTDEIQDLAGTGQLRVQASKGIHLVVPARPDPLGVRPDHPHRDLGAVRDPLGRPLDHRHHRHRLGPRQGAPRGQPRRHRLPAPPRQRGAARPARPRRRRGRVRRVCGRC